MNTSPEQNRVRAERVDAIAATVPQEIRDSGTLVVGTTGTAGPPLSFRADDDTTAGEAPAVGTAGAVELLLTIAVSHGRGHIRPVRRGVGGRGRAGLP